MRAASAIALATVAFVTGGCDRLLPFGSAAAPGPDGPADRGQRDGVTPERSIARDLPGAERSSSDLWPTLDVAAATEARADGPVLPVQTLAPSSGVNTKSLTVQFPATGGRRVVVVGWQSAAFNTAAVTQGSATFNVAAVSFVPGGTLGAGIYHLNGSPVPTTVAIGFLVEGSVVAIPMIISQPGSTASLCSSYGTSTPGCNVTISCPLVLDVITFGDGSLPQLLPGAGQVPLGSKAAGSMTTGTSYRPGANKGAVMTWDAGKAGLPWAQGAACL